MRRIDFVKDGFWVQIQMIGRGHWTVKIGKADEPMGASVGWWSVDRTEEFSHETRKHNDVVYAANPPLVLVKPDGFAVPLAERAKFRFWVRNGSIKDIGLCAVEIYQTMMRGVA